MKEEKYINGINKNTYNMLFNDKEKAIEGAYISSKDNLVSLIALFTLFNDKTIKGRAEKRKIEKEFHVDFRNIFFNKKTKFYEYRFKDLVIPFKKISDNINSKEHKEELLSRERFKKCHTRSIELIASMDRPANILTGTYIRHGNQYLHSVIEVEDEEENYIMDYTLNLIMSEEHYMELTDFRIIEKVKDLEILDEIKSGRRVVMKVSDMGTKEFLTFKHELKRDIEKNNFLLVPLKDENVDKKIERIKKVREEFERE